jgi:hypothetical protein
MNIFSLAHQAIRQLAMVGLLCTPFVLTPSYAAELVGKPVAVGSQGQAVKSAAATSAAQASIQSKSQAQSATAASAESQTQDIPQSPVEPVPPSVPDMDSPENDLHQAMDEMRDSFHQGAGGGFGDFPLGPETLIPIVAMLLLFGGPVILVIVLAFLHYRAKARRQTNINLNIDKLLAAGRDIPVELLMGEEATSIKRNVQGETVAVYSTGDDENMRKGVRNIGLGTGWLIFLTIMFGIKIGSFGFIFIGLGISQVVIWKLSATKSSAVQVQE